MSAGCLALALLAEPVRADDPVQEARETIQVFKKSDPGILGFWLAPLAGAVIAGYVYPRITGERVAEKEEQHEAVLAPH